MFAFYVSLVTIYCTCIRKRWTRPRRYFDIGFRFHVIRKIEFVSTTCHFGLLETCSGINENEVVCCGFMNYNVVVRFGTRVTIVPQQEDIADVQSYTNMALNSRIS